MAESTAPLYSSLLDTLQGGSSPPLVSSNVRQDLDAPLSLYLRGQLEREEAAETVAGMPATTQVGAASTTGEIWGRAVVAGGEQMTADVQTFGALWHLLNDNTEDAERLLNRAKLYQDASSEMLRSIGTFEEFLDEPTLDGFWDQVVKSVGQFTPMAVTSVASGFTGAAVQAVGKTALSAVSRKITREVMLDILKKNALARRGMGPALDANERAILNSAYGVARKARAGKNIRYTDVVAGGTAKKPGLPLSYGFWAGAGGQEYVVGSSQALHEFEEAGYKLTSDEAAAAYGLGIPQAIIGTLGERLFVGALHKRALGGYLKATRAGKTKEAAEYGGWAKEIAKGAVGGFAEGGLVEGTTELAQEELFIKQRQAIDPEYSSREANLRRAESAFAGFFAGAARSSPTSAAANVIGKARANMDFEDLARRGLDKVRERGGEGPFMEPMAGAIAQVEALINPTLPKIRAVWLSGEGTGLTMEEQIARAGEVIKGAVPDGGTLSLIKDDAEGKGILIFDSTHPDAAAIEQDAVESGFSEEFLAGVLEYTQLQTGLDAYAVSVVDAEGNILKSQSVSEANLVKTRNKFRGIYPDEAKYKIRIQFKEDAINDRIAKAQEEAAPAQEELDLGEVVAEVATKDVAGEGEIDELLAGVDSRAETVDPLGHDAQNMEDTIRKNLGDKAGDRFAKRIKERRDEAISARLAPAQQEFDLGTVTTEVEEAPAAVLDEEAEGVRIEEQAEPVRKPPLKRDKEGLTAAEVTRLEQEQPVLSYPAKEAGDEVADATTTKGVIKQLARISEEDTFTSYLEESYGEQLPEGMMRGLLDQLPSAYLEEFNRLATANRGTVYTPKQQTDGTWGIDAVRTPDQSPVSPAQMPDVVTRASRANEALKDSTKGWSVLGPNPKGPGNVERTVYMGTLVQHGVQLNVAEGKPFTTDMGRIAEGFNRAVEELEATGHTLLYEGRSHYDAAGAAAAPIFSLGRTKSGKYTTVSYAKAHKGRSELLGQTGQQTQDQIAALEEQIAQEEDSAVVAELEAQVEELEQRLLFDPEEQFRGQPPTDDARIQGGQSPPVETDPAAPGANELPPGVIPLSRVELDTTISTPGEQTGRGTKSHKLPSDEFDFGMSAILNDLVPNIKRILSTHFKLSPGTWVTTSDRVLDRTWKVRGTITYDGKQRNVGKVIQDAVKAKVRSDTWRGTYTQMRDTHFIVLRSPTNEGRNDEQVTKQVETLGHEFGHMLLVQELERSLKNPRLRARLVEAFEADKAKSSVKQYEGPNGINEWFADQAGIWVIDEARKPKNDVEGFFKRFVTKLKALWKDLRTIRSTANPVFTEYMAEVSEAYKTGSLDPFEFSYVDKVHIENMLDDLPTRVKKLLPESVMRKLRTMAHDILREGKDLLPHNKKHWGTEYFLMPAHNFLRRISPELAAIFYSPSQSTEKTGLINARVLLMNARLNDLWALAPKKTMGWNKGNPDLDAFRETLLKAEKDVPKARLSPEAQAVRTYLEDFYNDFISEKDPAVGFRKNFFPRILALADIRENPDLQVRLAEVLEKYNPDGPDDIVVVDAGGRELNRTEGSFQKIVEALVREDQSNIEDVAGSVSEVAIGMVEERAKYFTNVPNEALRDIEALEDVTTSIRKYIEDMTKRLAYLDMAQVVIEKGDIAAVGPGNPNLDFLTGPNVQAGDTVRGWQATEVLLARIPDPRDREDARVSIKAMLGKTGLNMNPIVRKVNSVLLTMNIMSYLTFATLASLPDLAGPALRSKDFSALKTSLGVLRHYFTNREEMQQFARDVGVVTFDALSTTYINAAELGYMTPKAQLASEIFFKSIGLEAYTRFTRVFALGMGEQFLKKHAQDSSDLSSRYLAELQVSREDIKHWLNNERSFSDEQGTRVQAALGRFVDESIVRPSSAERPIWASNPYTALIWQLKSFFYAYGKNIIGGAMRETQNRYSETGRLTSASIPLLLGATTLLPLTMVGLELREWIKYFARGGDERAFRSDNMDFGEYSLDIIDRAGIPGPFGLALPILQAKNFGDEFWVPPLGPTAERIEDLVKGKMKLMDIVPYAGSIGY